jgi:hypothetical protein
MSAATINADKTDRDIKETVTLMGRAHAMPNRETLKGEYLQRDTLAAACGLGTN